MKTIRFQITDEAFDLLKQINKEGYAEYRDTRYETLEEFKNSDEYDISIRTEEWFLNRNFNGTLKLALELSNYGLIENDFDSWHKTYIVSDFGKEILNNN